MDNFTKEDTVVLKSGSPEMTIVSIQDDKVECSWYDKKHGPQKEIFHKHMLKKYIPSSNITHGWGAF